MDFGTKACDVCIRNCHKHNHRPEERYIFFKLMFGNEYKNLLYLPPEFARTVQHLVDQETQIEDINGKQWSVTVSKVENSLAFQKGWAEFFEDHDLRHGEFLIFEYDKGSHFWVRILGKSATERKDFNNKMCSPNKRPRRSQATATESEPFQVNSVANPISDASGAVESQFQSRQTNLAVKNADSGGMQHDSVSLNMEELTCMMNRNDGNYYEGEDRNNLNLAIFEMQNRTSDPSNFGKGLSTKEDSSGDDPEQTKTMEDAAVTGVVCKSPIKAHSNSIDTSKVFKKPSENRNMNKGTLDDVSNDQNGRRTSTVDSVLSQFCDKILNVKSEKAMEIELAPEITMQAAGHSDGIYTSKLFKKPSENRNMSKGTLDDVSNDHNGSCKIAEGVHAIYNRSHEFPISLGKDAINIKQELIEMKNEGSEPAVVRNDDLISSPEVKYETDMSCDIGPSVAISPFLAEVISKSFLELPADLKIRGKKDKKANVVYLRNSIGELCCVLCPDQPGIKALTNNWGTFCDSNNIKPGDECRFTQEKNQYAQWAFRVDVVCRRESSRK